MNEEKFGANPGADIGAMTSEWAQSGTDITDVASQPAQVVADVASQPAQVVADAIQGIHQPVIDTGPVFEGLGDAVNGSCLGSIGEMIGNVAETIGDFLGSLF